jgi:hypothetical protein
MKCSQTKPIQIDFWDKPENTGQFKPNESFYDAKEREEIAPF